MDDETGGCVDIWGCGYRGTDGWITSQMNRWMNSQLWVWVMDKWIGGSVDSWKGMNMNSGIQMVGLMDGQLDEQVIIKYMYVLNMLENSASHSHSHPQSNPIPYPRPKHLNPTSQSHPLSKRIIATPFPSLKGLTDELSYRHTYNGTSCVRQDNGIMCVCTYMSVCQPIILSL